MIYLLASLHVIEMRLFVNRPFTKQNVTAVFGIVSPYLTVLYQPITSTGAELYFSKKLYFWSCS